RRSKRWCRTTSARSSPPRVAMTEETAMVDVATTDQDRELDAQAEATRAGLEAAAAAHVPVIVGHTEAVEAGLTALVAGGHVLLEGVPGLGKTLLVRTLGEVSGLEFGRIQFTPDLMPADITGAQVFDRDTGRLEFSPGPVFTNLLL